MKKTFRHLVAGLSLLSVPLSAQPYFTANSGNWNDPATWVGKSVPPASKSTITISEQHSVRLNAPVRLVDAKLFVRGGLVIPAGMTLTVEGGEAELRLESDLTGEGELILGGGTFDIRKEIRVDCTIPAGKHPTVTNNASGDNRFSVFQKRLSIAPTGSLSLRAHHASYALVLNGELNNAGTICDVPGSANASTLAFNGSACTNTGTISLGALHFGGGSTIRLSGSGAIDATPTVAWSTTLLLTGDQRMKGLNVNGDSKFSLNGKVLVLYGGGTTIAGDGVIALSPGTVVYASDVIQNVAPLSYNNLTLDNGEKLLLNGPCKVSGSLKVVRKPLTVVSGSVTITGSISGH